MATVDVKDLDGATIRQIELADEVLAAKPNQSLLWEVVKAYRANQRRGTHATKSRGEVRGGGKKPWRQKGTGRARAGSIRSSLWRHGSIAHGPKPRDYSVKLSVRTLRSALRSAVAIKFQEKKLAVVDQIELEEVKTKALAGALKRLGIEKSVLVVQGGPNRNLELSSRNIPRCDLVRRHDLHAYDVLSHDELLVSEQELTRLVEALR